MTDLICPPYVWFLEFTIRKRQGGKKDPANVSLTATGSEIL